MTIQGAISKYELSLTENERKIADYILKNGSEISMMNSTQLSDVIGTSQSAIIKFVKKIGFNGFTDFKIQAREDFVNQEQMNSLKSQNVSLADPLADIIGAIYGESIDSLEQTYLNLNQDVINTCIAKMEEADRIYVCGKGASFLPAQDLASKLLKFGMTVIAISDLETVELTAKSAKARDVYLFFSFSGETEELLRIMDKVKLGGAYTIVVTKNLASLLAKQANVCIEIVTNETKYRVASMSSRIAFFSIVDILFLGILKNDLQNRLKKLPLSKKKKDFSGNDILIR